MNVRKRLIVSTLLVINIIMLMAIVVPHHHHSNGIICLKVDQPIEQQQCPIHQHHHGANDSCCNDECKTRFQTTNPSFHSNNGPDYIFVAILFTDHIIEQILHPLDKQTSKHFVFRESLHSTKTPRTSSLRAPPSFFIA